MAQQKYTVNLLDTVYPLLSNLQTRTVIGTVVGQAPAATERPSVAYMHNVMPTRYGMQAVGYLQVSGSAYTPSLPSTYLTDIITAFSREGDRMYLGFSAGGNILKLTPTGGTAWTNQGALPGVAAFAPVFDYTKVTAAVVNGQSYFFYAGFGMFEHSTTSSAFFGVAVPALTTADVLGIVASSGYLIAYTADSIAWSSTIDPTDFAPSKVTGAGGGRVAGTDGDILFVTANSLGILVYTENNVIAGTYTGNALYPFKFREVDNSKGGVDKDLVAYEANSSNQFVYSKAGLQSVTSQKADMFLPEVTDFLAGKIFEDFNNTTNELEITTLLAAEKLKKRIKYIASRYIVISYGLPSTKFTHALVVDTALNKVGKLKISHIDVFEYVGTQVDAAQESMAFLDDTGVVLALSFTSIAARSGTLIMGKLQATLSRFLGLMEVEVENIPDGAALQVLSSASLDGKNFTNVLGTIATNDPDVRKYNFRSSAKTHNIIVIGEFDLVTLLVAYRIEGKR